MSKIIAISGKGGSGKSTLAALAVRFFSKDTERKIFLVDADPSVNLTLMLGMDARRTLGSLREKFIASPEAAQEAMFGDRHIRDTIRDHCLQDAGNFTLLTMGRPEGPGCFCSVNQLLRYGIESISRNFDLTIIDCEAGPEQVNRRVTKDIDHLFLVTEPTVRSAHTALHIKSIAEKYAERESFAISVIMNKSRPESEAENMASILKDGGLEIEGQIPLDPHIAAYDAVGKSTLDLPDDSPGVKATQEIFSAYLARPAENLISSE